MSRPDYLQLRDFRRLQHYRDRTPPWIKHYNADLDDDAFLALGDAARGHLMLIRLLASRRDNKIPNDARLVGRAIQSSGKVDLDGLIAVGFLESWAGDASTPLASPPPTPLAPRQQSASNPLAKSIENANGDASTPLASRAPARSRRERERGRERAGSSGDTDLLAAPPRFSLDDLAQVPAVRDFVTAYYARGIASPQRRQDVADQLLALVNGGVEFNGCRIRAHGDPDRALDRLAAKCQTVLASTVRIRDSAIVVLLKILADTSDDSAPGHVDEQRAVETRHHEHVSTAADELAAEAWLTDHAEVADAVEAELVAQCGLPDPDDRFSALARRWSRRSLVLTAWRARDAPPSDVGPR